MTSISELTFFGSPVIYFNQIESTSDYLKNIDVEYPLLVLADYQTNGRGQYGKTWESESGKNLCFSFQLFPLNLSIEQGFKISQFIALSLVKILNELTYPEKARIKWPNDIILQDKKVAGILVETTFFKTEIEKIVVGIGLNVSQETFSIDLSNASSINELLLDKKIDRFEILKKFIWHLETYLKLDFQDDFQERFNENLYRKDEIIKLSQDNEVKEFLNMGIDIQGRWILQEVKSGKIVELVSSRDIEFHY